MILTCEYVDVVRGVDVSTSTVGRNANGVVSLGTQLGKQTELMLPASSCFVEKNENSKIVIPHRVSVC